MKIASWIVTALFLLSFLNQLPELLSERPISIPYIIGAFIGTLIVPGIMWGITFSLPKKEQKEQDKTDF